MKTKNYYQSKAKAFIEKYNLILGRETKGGISDFAKFLDSEEPKEDKSEYIYYCDNKQLSQPAKECNCKMKSVCGIDHPHHVDCSSEKDLCPCACHLSLFEIVQRKEGVIRRDCRHCAFSSPPPKPTLPEEIITHDIGNATVVSVLANKINELIDYLKHLEAGEK